MDGIRSLSHIFKMIQRSIIGTLRGKAVATGGYTASQRSAATATRWSLLQELQRDLGSSIRLGEHRDTRLLEDVVSGQIGGFCRKVYISNPALRSDQVLGVRLKVVQGR